MWVILGAGRAGRRGQVCVGWEADMSCAGALQNENERVESGVARGMVKGVRRKRNVALRGSELVEMRLQGEQ
jgi:hypothetical protein